jgi:hypothetical protein
MTWFARAHVLLSLALLALGLAILVRTVAAGVGGGAGLLFGGALAALGALRLWLARR